MSTCPACIRRTCVRYHRGDVTWLADSVTLFVPSALPCQHERYFIHGVLPTLASVHTWTVTVLSYAIRSHNLHLNYRSTAQNYNQAKHDLRVQTFQRSNANKEQDQLLFGFIHPFMCAPWQKIWSPDGFCWLMGCWVSAMSGCNYPHT